MFPPLNSRSISFWGILFSSFFSLLWSANLPGIPQVPRNPEEFISSEISIDFAANNILFKISVPIDKPFLSSQESMNLERELTQKVPSLLLSDFLLLPISSSENLQEYLSRYNQINRIFGMADFFYRKHSIYASQKFELTFFAILYPRLMNELIFHTLPLPLPILSSPYNQNQEYTGLVIFVDQDTPSMINPQGIPDQKNTSSSFELPSPTLTRVLLPKLLNEKRQTLYELQNILPEYARKWGVVEYSSPESKEFLQDKFQDRIGSRPLYVSAYALSGPLNQDIVLMEDTIKALFSNKKNAFIFQQARILIVVE